MQSQPLEEGGIGECDPCWKGVGWMKVRKLGPGEYVHLTLPLKPMCFLNLLDHLTTDHYQF